MSLIKAYCGLMMVRENANYYCVDRYTMDIKAKGTRQECEKFFKEYVNRIAERS